MFQQPGNSEWMYEIDEQMLQQGFTGDTLLEVFKMVAAGAPSAQVALKVESIMAQFKGCLSVQDIAALQHLVSPQED